MNPIEIIPIRCSERVPAEGVEVLAWHSGAWRCADYWSGLWFVGQEAEAVVEIWAEMPGGPE